VVFGRPIGQTQGIQFPIAKAYASMRAAELMVKEATRKYEAGLDCGAEANMAKDAGGGRLLGKLPTPACRPMAASASPKNTTSNASSARRGSIRFAPISTNLIFVAPCRACAGHASLLLRNNDAALEGLIVIAVEQAVRRTILQLTAGRCRRACDQGGAARGRLCTRLRCRGERTKQLFRLAQPRQGFGGHRPRDRGRTREPRTADRRRGRADPESQAGFRWTSSASRWIA